MQKSRWGWVRSIVWLTSVLFVLSIMAGPAMSSSKKPIIFADLGWDSVQVHNRVAGFIIQHGLGYDVKYTPGETIMLNTALINAKGGDAPNVNMETWTENWQELYDKGIAKGKDPSTKQGFIHLGANFPNSVQGWYVPTYMIKGDAKRGIKASAPGLKSVFDMPKYWKLFKDPEDPKKGLFYSCIPGWSCKLVNDKKFEAYGLQQYYNKMEPGSGAALAGSMEAAYKKGKPWIGYYWAPTWVLGKLDMTQLEEPPFDDAIFRSTAACSYPAVKCDIIVHKKLPDWAPDVVAFLKNYETSLDINNKFLAHMRDTGGKPKDGAMWFLKTYEDLWTKWIPADAVTKVKAAMK
ncbi:Glycine betaine/L-proline transport substrate-binding protein ProX (TC 3.A.1.12.1) [Olavius algarvensis associated proteobacterium Delta 3]|nr:Glycine betaine/L-proline transport substrate-binding protein ProX (TC 3.A.1.12.1) [Olavius algarvensis associated proteobacterium Delta 3]